MRAAFGLTKDRERVKFSTRITVDIKAIGEIKKERARVCFSKIMLQSES